MTTALITLFHPPLDTESCVRAIAAQVDRVFLCDNSPSSVASSLFENIPNARYLHFGENLGISRAFNRILSDPGFDWTDDEFVIFFDQDSRIGDGHIEGLLSRFRALEAAGKNPGCLGPVFSRHHQTPGEDCFPVSCTITSSLLCRYGTLQAVGFWNEQLFLDLADWDLCWRLQKAGFGCWMTDAIRLDHRLGLGEKKIGPFRLRVGKPYREYYQIRDGLYLMGCAHTPLAYRLRFLANLLIRTPLHMIFLDHRKARWHYVWQGLKDHFQNIRGSLESRSISESTNGG